MDHLALHRLMYGLFYPAVLGTIFVSFIVVDIQNLKVHPRFFYILYKIYLWARGKSQGAFVLFAILPLMSFFPIPPSVPKSMENVEQKQHKQKEDSGVPPDT